MSLKAKSAIFAVLTALLLYFNYPTLINLAFDNRALHSSQIKAHYAVVKENLDTLKNFNLAIVEADKNRIRLLKNPAAGDGDVSAAVFSLPVFADILDGNFSFETVNGSLTLEMKPDAPKDIFLSDVAEKLNRLFENAKKIDRIVLRENIPDIQFFMTPGSKLVESSHPINSFVGSDYDWLYHNASESYSLSVKEFTYALNLGLDLQGGIYLDLGVDTDKVIAEQIQSNIESLKTVFADKNIFLLDIKSVNDRSIEIYPTDVTQLNLEDETYSAWTTGYDVEQTEFGYRLTISNEEIDRIAKLTVDQSLNTIRNRTNELGVKEPIINRKGDDSIIVQLPGISDPERAVNLIKKSAVLEFRLVSDGSAEIDSEFLNFEEKDPVTGEIIDVLPLSLEKRILLKGDSISDARVAYDQFNTPYVSLIFKNQAAQTFGDITTKYTQRQLAIVLDNIVQSYPSIREPIYGGQAQITGNFSVEEASDLALVLRSGSLPAPLIIKEQKTVGASLGEETIQKSLLAMAAGFACLVIFLIVWYKLSGVYAVLTLIFNLMLLTANLAYFGATLTLPGLAGIILTIGMAVDSNVLIFERIREEMASGETVNRKIIATSFSKAFSTILDANITTLFASLILFQFGSGPIKGFAVTLSVGIFSSVFSAMLFTRLLLELTYLNKNKNVPISV